MPNIIPPASGGEQRPNIDGLRATTAELLQFLSEHANNPPYIPERDDEPGHSTPAPLSPEREAEIRERVDRTRLDTIRAAGYSATGDVGYLLAELDRVRAENEQLRAEYETASKSYWNGEETADEYGIRISDGSVIDVRSGHGDAVLDELSRQETAERLTRRRDSRPDAQMVQRTVRYGEWTEAR